MPPKSIPAREKQEVEQIVERFNQSDLKKTNCCYIPRYRGRYLYLDRESFSNISQICRLTYTGKMDDWEFSIFKYSSEKYDPDEWFFPGSEFVNGTIEGAM